MWACRDAAGRPASPWPACLRCMLRLTHLRRSQEAGGQAPPGQEPGQAGGFGGEVQAGPLPLPSVLHSMIAARLSEVHVPVTAELDGLPSHGSCHVVAWQQ